jgi:hypothetical protein
MRFQVGDKVVAKESHGGRIKKGVVYTVSVAEPGYIGTLEMGETKTNWFDWRFEPYKADGFMNLYNKLNDDEY